MGRSTWCPWLLAGSIVAGCLCVPVGSSEAAEETQRFLDGLRQRGLYDVALDYLGQMRTSRLADEPFRAKIDYEVGLTLIDSSRTGRVIAVRERQLEEARKSLQKFLKEHPSHELATGAHAQLANLLVERGRIKIEQAGRPNTSAGERVLLRKQARAVYREARGVFEELEERLSKMHKEFGLVDPKDTKRVEQRDLVRGDWVNARLALATVVYEIGMTYDPEKRGKSRTDHLNEAAKRYRELYNKYGRWVAGLYARMWEGRCYRELGDSKKALKVFEALLVEPGEGEEFRLLKNKTLVLLLETALLPKEKKYRKAVEKARRWEQSTRGREESSPEGLAIKYLAGEAALEYARSLKKEEAGGTRADYLKDAKQSFLFVARHGGQYQKKARQRLTVREFVGEDYVPPEPASFVEARNRARDELDRSQRTDLKEEEVAKARTDAIKYYRMAIGMKTPEVTVDEVNVIRYYLAYLYWVSDAPYEAAVMGEFLARRYPNGPGARQGARIAMAAYAKLYNGAPREQRQFEADRMVEIADYIAAQWKDEPEAAEARMMLIRAALGDGDLEKAREYLDKIPPDSPRRGEVELMTGQKLWATYLQASGKDKGERPSRAELDNMVSQARKILEDGVARMREAVDAGGEVSYALVASVLSLAQISIEAGEPGKAVEWMEDEKTGALMLATADHPATDRGNFRVETYKAALRAYVATQQVEKAEQIMKSLEELAKKDGDSEAGRKLTRIYVSLGHELQQQLERLRSEEKIDQLDKVSQGFERFLDRISQREEGNTFNSLSWVAETFHGLASGFDPGGKTLPPEAETYYQKSAETYRKLLRLCEEEKIACPPGATTSVKVRLARCLRRRGQFNEAMSLLLGVLRARPTMVDAQVEAAYTYQARGEEKPGYYELAISGSRKYKEIWGWGKIARMVARSEKHRSLFHEARYNMALCRFKRAQKTRSEKGKAAMLKQAEKQILVVERLYPEMGGDSWKGKYDELLKRIQKLRGKTALGLN